MGHRTFTHPLTKKILWYGQQESVFLRSIFYEQTEYLLIVENRRFGARVKQHVIRYLGRKDRLKMDDVFAILEALRRQRGEKRVAIHGPATEADPVVKNRKAGQLP